MILYSDQVTVVIFNRINVKFQCFEIKMELWETYFLQPITPFRLTGHAISENNAQIYQQNLYFRRN